MAQPIAVSGIHHLRLTVTDVIRSRAFYTKVLGFDVAAQMPPPATPRTTPPTRSCLAASS